MIIGLLVRDISASRETETRQLNTISDAERTYVVDAHVERLVHDDPRNRFLATRLSHRAVVSDVVTGGR